MPEGLPDAFLWFDYDVKDHQGHNLQGESVDPQFFTHFQISNFSFSLTGKKNSAAGGRSEKGSAGGKQEAGTAASVGGEDEPFPPVSVTMPTQIGSPWLMKLCTQFGKGDVKLEEQLKIQFASIFVRRAGATTLEESGQEWFLRFTMAGVTIASYQTSIECQDTFTLNYEDMTVEYHRCDPSTRLRMQAPTTEAPIITQKRRWLIGNPKNADDDEQE